MITVNLDKAKEIWKNNIRQNRVKLFEILDVLFFKAIETNNIVEQASISVKKQKLRDITSDPRLQYISSAEELKNFDPLSEIMI